MSALDSAIKFVGHKYLSFYSGLLPTTRQDLYQNQEANLLKLKLSLRGTQIYKDLNLKDVNSYSDFLDFVPVLTYDQFGPYIDDLFQGNQHSLFNDKLDSCGLSSGTSGANSKRVPYNQSMIDLFVKAQRTLAARLTKLEPNLKILEADRLTFGSSPFLYEEKGVKFGYISGILSTKVPSLLASRTFPSAQTLNIVDWNEKINALLEETVARDIRIVSGIPTYIISIFESVLEKTGCRTISELWPNLEIFIYAATPIAQYRDRIDQLMGKPLRYYGLYAATEAPIGLPFAEFKNGTQKYLLNPDLLVSFSPVDNPKVNLGVHQIELKKSYFINIGTPNGLVHYAMKDVIRFSLAQGNQLVFEFVGRKATGMNLAAEKVTDQEILDCVSAARKKLNVDLKHFFLAPSEALGKSRYLWTIFVSEGARVNSKSIATFLDEELSRINADYLDCRQVNVLDFPEVKIMNAHSIQDYFERNRHKGQFKMKTTFETHAEFQKFMDSEIINHRGNVC